MQRVLGADKPAFGKEDGGLRPVGGIAVDGLVVGADEEAVGWEGVPSIVGDVEAWLAGAGAGGGGEEAEGFFDHGGGVGSWFKRYGWDVIFEAVWE